MSRRILGKRQIANRQRRAKRDAEWKSLPPAQQNLVVRRTITRKDALRANANAQTIEAQAYSEGEVAEMMKAAETAEESE